MLGGFVALWHKEAKCVYGSTVLVAIVQVAVVFPLVVEAVHSSAFALFRAKSAFGVPFLAFSAASFPSALISSSGLASLVVSLAFSCIILS